MSATGRSDVRRKDDHYVTPDWAIRSFLAAYALPEGPWLDPCAANGELITVARSVVPSARFTAVELRPEAAPYLQQVAPGAHAIGDFLAMAPQIQSGIWSAVITNPPYSLAVPFLIECRRIAKVVAFLLRIGFYCGGRGPLSRESKPGLFFLPNRPSFTGDGADASEYAWFVYGDPEVLGTSLLFDGDAVRRDRALEQARSNHSQSFAARGGCYRNTSN